MWLSPTNVGLPSPASSVLSPAMSTPAWPPAASPWPAKWTSTAPSPSTSACASPATPSPCWTSTTPCPPPCTRPRLRASSITTTSSTTPSWASTAATPPSCKLCADRAVKYQLIQHRLLEPAGSDPDFTRGTLEGDIAPGEITFYRLQSTADGQLRCYVAEGEVLPVPTCSFGGIGVFAIPRDGPFLPPRAGGEALSPPRRRGLWPSRQGPLRAVQAAGHPGHRLQPAQGACSTRPRTPSPKKENAIQKGGTPGGMPLFLLLLGLLPP